MRSLHSLCLAIEQCRLDRCVLCPHAGAVVRIGFSRPREGSCEKIENLLLPASSVHRSARATLNVCSERVFTCGP